MNPADPDLDCRRARVTASPPVVVVSLMLGLLFASFAAEAQQAGTVYRIGWLSLAVGPTPRAESFLQGLRDLGYVEGQHFVMEYRRAAGNSERLPGLAADLVRAKVDVILAASTQATLPAKQATQTIPIVFVATDPVERGFVTSLARPGANMTGVTLTVGLAKHVQLLTELAPKVSRVAHFYTPTIGDEFRQAYLARLEADARALGVKLDQFPVREPGEVERAFSEITRTGANGLLVDNPSLLLRIRERLCGLASKHKLPAMGRGREFADAGCLVSYGENLEEVYRRAATYVDRILKGTKPADLPVEQAAKFEFVINTKTARALGLTISPSLLLRADQLVE